MISQRFTGIGMPEDRNGLSPPEFADLRGLRGVQPYLRDTRASYNIQVGDTPERISAWCPPSFFKMLGVKEVRPDFPRTKISPEKSR